MVVKAAIRPTLSGMATTRSPATGVNFRSLSFVRTDERARDTRHTDVEPSPSQDTLVTAHYGRLRRLCRLLLGDPQEAEDVVQDVFLKAHEAEQLGRPPLNWSGWLTRVAVNACRDRRRAGGWMRFRLRGTSLDDVSLVSETPGPSEALVSEETRRRIWAAFRELPRRQQEVFVLRYIDDQSTPDVAQTLGLSAGSVKRHLFRAVRHMRRTLGDHP
jgi:RNA polymerase sigma factor (sigma-70 family)